MDAHHEHGHQGDMKHQIADEWRAYWQQQSDIPAWDYTSQIVLEALWRAGGSFSGRTVLEAGCGTGRISLALAREGARVSCLDVSVEAVQYARALFAEAGVPAHLSLASLFAIPFPAGQFDVVWNAGVLEHFSKAERVEALRELLRVIAPGGVLITLNPYRFALLYRLGKWLAERLGKWPYGHEDPIATLRQASRGLPCATQPEFSTGCFVILVESLRAVRWLSPVVRRLRNLLIRAHRSRWGGIVRTCDRIGSRLVGGYLLVSVFRKTGDLPMDGEDARGEAVGAFLNRAGDG